MKFFRSSLFFRTFIYLTSRTLPRSSKNLLPFIFLGLQARNPFKSANEPEPERRTASPVLSKNDYFKNVIGNSKDLFFFIVFQEESAEALEEAQRIAEVLGRSSGKYLGNKQITIYLIERGVYRDIRATINRVKNMEIYEKDRKNNQLEIFFKVTYASEPVNFKYKPNSFYSERGQKKMFRLVKKLVEPVDAINDSETFLQILKEQQANRIDSSLVVKVIEGFSNEKTMRKFEKTAGYLFERKLVPLTARFMVIKKPNLASSLGLTTNETYIFRNDFWTKYNQIFGVGSESANEGSSIEVADQKGLYFEKYSLFKRDFLESEKLVLKELKDEKVKEMSCFVSFVSPRVFLLRDSKTKSLAPFFKRINLNRKRPILSLLLTDHDILANTQRLLLLQTLYAKYHKDFYFLVFYNDEMEDFFPHANRENPKFCIFNFFNQDKTSNVFKNYYKSLLFPYEKHFLADEGSFFEREEEVQGKIEGFLAKGKDQRRDFVSKSGELVNDINADLFNKYLGGGSFILELYDQTLESEFARRVFNELCEECRGGNNQGDSIRFLRMNSLNDSPHIPNIHSFPAYIYWDSQTRKIHVFQPDFSLISFRKPILESELKTFIFSGNRN